MKIEKQSLCNESGWRRTTRSMSASGSQKLGSQLALPMALALVCSAAATEEARHTPSDKVQPAVHFEAEPFDLADVTLLDSPFKDAMERNRRVLLSLEPDRFLHNFRYIAGLQPKAPIYGGWESPNAGAGRCLGHYLSALSMQYRATGERQFKQRVDYIVSELALCQQANGDGFLSAQAGVREAFAELAKGKGDALFKSRVPWYIQHKMWAGLRDAYELTGNEQAREVLIRLADWAIETTKALDDAQFQIMLQQEVGGMQEVLADVYGITGDSKYLALSERFYDKSVQDPIVNHKDGLKGLHANTQIPKFIGSARIYELTGSERSRDMAEFFWDRVVHHHTYVTGGDSEDEHFGEPDHLADRLGARTAETCNTYNMLRLTRHLIEWNPKVERADFYERALYNHILASQDPHNGMFTFFLSLKPGHFRTYSTPFDSFWCCFGTGMENHTRYGESIYFHDADSLYVNLFIPSELNWRDKGVMVKQQTHYPESGNISFTVSSAKPARFAFKVRYPGWASPGFSVTVNGQPVRVTAHPGDYVTIEREWKSGDRLEVQIPLGLRIEPTPDDPDKIAILYGPVVLGGDLGTNGLLAPYVADQRDYTEAPTPDVPVLVTSGRPIETWLKPVSGKPLTFRTQGVGRPNDVTLLPFYLEYFERYTVFWDVLSAAEWQEREVSRRARN